MTSLRVILLVCVLALIGLGFPRSALANPVFGDQFTARQPDGSLVTYRIWGDEFYSITESLDGYALIRQSDGWICYARLSTDGRQLLSSGIHASDKLPASKLIASAIVPHARIAPEARDALIEKARREILGPELKTKWAGKPAQLGAIKTGSPKGITLLIDFPDQPGTIPAANIDNLINQPGYTGYSNKGSVRDYFYDVSRGKLTYTNYVSPTYYRALHNKSYYDNTSDSFGSKARELIREAFNDLEAKGFDFSQYDYDNNGYVDAINVFYAGSAASGWEKGLWPHSGSGLGLTFDGKQCNAYQISDIGSSPSIGTFCHENGHMLLGFPDLYDYGYESRGAGKFCLMANHGSTNPVQPCAYLRVKAGWVNVIPLASPAARLPISAGGDSIYKFAHPTRSNEYFLIENRNYLYKRDSYLPAAGLTVWHIDENMLRNDYEQMTWARHYTTTLLQADGKWELEHNLNDGSAADVFNNKNTKYPRVDPLTKPDTRWWDGADSGLNLHDFGDPTTVTMTFAFGDNDILTMSQATGLAAFGFEGGPFTPSSIAYSMKNTSGLGLNWSASADVPWVDLSSSGGSLGAGAITSLNVSINNRAKSMLPGDYSGILTVRDLATGVDLKRKLSLQIKGRNLVAWWKLDDRIGTATTDATGNGYHGRFMGALQWTASSIQRGGLAFSGAAGSYVQVPPLGLYRNTATITAWVKRSGTQPTNAGLVFWRGADTVTGLSLGSGHALRYCWSDDSSTYNFKSGLIVPDGQWCFTAMVVEPSRATLYLHDGVSLRTVVNNVAHGMEEFNGSGSLGNDTYTTSRLFKGELDDIRVYDYPLTPEEIAAVMQVGGRAENPQPPHGARGIAKLDRLRWTPALGSVSHNVYLGTTPGDVQGANPSSPQYFSSVPGPAIPPGSLASSTTYYWRVDEVTATGTSPGPVWSFTTTSTTLPAPLAHWRLDESSGTTARDSIGSLQGTLQGAAHWTPAAGRFDGAVELDGISSQVALPALPYSGNALTISAWIKRNDLTAGRSGLVLWNNAGLSFFGANELNYSWTGLNVSSVFNTGIEVPSQIWCFVALVVQPSAATIYLHDGIKMTSVTNVMNHAVMDFNKPGVIGYKTKFMNDPNYFGGLVDDVRFYDRSLSPGEIAAVMASITPAPGQATQPSPADRFRFAQPQSALALSWLSGAGPARHEIYFGATNPPSYQGAVLSPTFFPELPRKGPFYWRIDEVNSGGTTPGPVWSFDAPGRTAVRHWDQY